MTLSFHSNNKPARHADRFRVSLFIPSLAGLVFLAGCSKPATSVAHDEFIQQTTFASHDGELPGYYTSGLKASKVYLDLEIDQRDSGQYQAYFKVQSLSGESHGMFNLNEKDSLAFLADNFHAVLSCSTHRIETYALAMFHVGELAYYPVQIDQVERILSAKDVRIKLYGTNKDEVRTVDESSLANMREVLQRLRLLSSYSTAQ